MMKSLLSVLSVAVIAAAAAFADEEMVPLDKLPAAVKDAVKKRFPKAEVKGASKEKENDKTVYEVTLKENGKNIDVSLTEAGAISLIEKEVAFKDLPKAVAATFEAKYP